MKKFISQIRLVHIILIALAALGFGCATTGPNGDPVDGMTVAEQIYNQDGPIIQGGITLLITAYEQFVLKNPDKRDALNAELISINDKLSRAVNAAQATAGGTVAPKDLMDALKVKEDYIDRMLQSFVPIYSAEYGKIKDADELHYAQYSLKWIKLLSDAIKQATGQPILEQQ